MRVNVSTKNFQVASRDLDYVMLSATKQMFISVVVRNLASSTITHSLIGQLAEDIAELVDSVFDGMSYKPDAIVQVHPALDGAIAERLKRRGYRRIIPLMATLPLPPLASESKPKIVERCIEYYVPVQ